jgi:hypothetical protein
MSRSVELVSNPAVITLKWKNEKFDKKSKTVTQECGWYYWDKSLNEGEGGNVHVPMPLVFNWLESAQSFTGWHKTLEKGVYSNEILTSQEAVKKYGLQKLVAKVGNDVIAEGFYKDIKETVNGVGGKFCIPVYASMELNGEYQIVRFLMTGSAGGAWMEFNKPNLNRTKTIVCYDKKEVTMPTGSTYEMPVFKYVAATEEQDEKANELVKEVDAYFEYLNSGVEKEEEVDTDYDN